MKPHLDDASRMRTWVDERLAHDKLPWPHVLTLHISDRCNHCCPWCWFKHVPRDIDIDATFRVLDFLLELGATEVIVSGGGEPLLHPDVERLLIRLAAVTEVHRRLYTNGSLLGRYREAVAAAFDYVRVSIDAGGPELYARLHGTHKKEYHSILAELARLNSQKQGLTVGVSMVVTEENICSIQRLVCDSTALGIRHILLKPLIINDRCVLPDGFENAIADAGSEVWVRLPSSVPSSIDTMPAKVASLKLAFLPDGYIYPCCHLCDERYRISPIDLDSLVEAYGSARHLSILQRYSGTPHPCHAHDLWSIWRVENSNTNN